MNDEPVAAPDVKSGIGLEMGENLLQEPGICEGCHTLQEELAKVKTDYELNYSALKEKIISTDLLIKKYTSKCQECDIQSKKVEELHKQLEKYRRDCELLESKLKTTLQEAEPLKQTKERLEAAQRLQQHELQSLRDKLDASEATKKMYDMAKASQEEKTQEAEHLLSEAKKNCKDLEVSNKKHKSQIRKLQGEVTSKNAERKQLVTARTKLEKRVDFLEQLLRDHGVPQNLIQAKRTSRAGRRAPARNRHQQGESPQQQPTRPSSDVSSDEELLLNRLMDDEDGEGISLFRPIAHALSPLPPSPPSFEDEGSEDSVDDMAEVLESALSSPGPANKKSGVNDSSPRARGRPPRRPTRRRGNPGQSKLIHDSVGVSVELQETDDSQSTRVVESGLSSEGVLTLQESLSDSEHEMQQDMPFQKLDYERTLGSDLQLSTSSTSESEGESPAKSLTKRSLRKRRGAGRTVAVTVPNNSGEPGIITPERRRTRSMSQESSSGSDLSDGSSSPGVASPKVTSPRTQPQNASPFKKPLPVSPRRRGRPPRVVSSRSAENSPTAVTISGVAYVRRVTRSISCPGVSVENMKGPNQEKVPPTKDELCAKVNPIEQSVEETKETPSVVIPTPTRKRVHAGDDQIEGSKSPMAKSPCTENVPQSPTNEIGVAKKTSNSEGERPKEFGSVVAAFMDNLKSAFQKTVKTKQTESPPIDQPVIPTLPTKPTRKSRGDTPKCASKEEKESKRNKLVAMKGITRLQSGDEPPKAKEQSSGSEPVSDNYNPEKEGAEMTSQTVAKTDSLDVLSETRDDSPSDLHRPLSKTKSTGFIIQSLDEEVAEMGNRSGMTANLDGGDEGVVLKLNSQGLELEGDPSCEVKPMNVPQLNIITDDKVEGAVMADGEQDQKLTDRKESMLSAEVPNTPNGTQDQENPPEDSNQGVKGAVSESEKTSQICKEEELSSSHIISGNDGHTDRPQPNQTDPSQRRSPKDSTLLSSEHTQQDPVSDSAILLNVPGGAVEREETSSMESHTPRGSKQSDSETKSETSDLTKVGLTSAPPSAKNSLSAGEPPDGTSSGASKDSLAGKRNSHGLAKIGIDESNKTSATDLFPCETLSEGISENTSEGSSRCPEEIEDDPLCLTKGRGTLRRQFSVDAGKRSASDMSDKGVSLRTKFVGTKAASVQQPERADTQESSGTIVDLPDRPTDDLPAGSSNNINQPKTKSEVIPNPGQSNTPSVSGVKVTKDTPCKTEPSGGKDKDSVSTGIREGIKREQLDPAVSGCRKEVAVEGARQAIHSRPARPTSLQYLPPTISAGTSRAPPQSPATPDTDLPVSPFPGPAGRSETPTAARTPSVLSESPMSSLPPSPMEKVECITPLSPMLPSDQSDALSPLSFTLSDTEDIGNPISPLPPSPVPMDQEDLEGQGGDGPHPSISPSPSPTEPSPGPSPFLCPIKEPSAAEDWERLPLPEKISPTDEFLPPLHQPKARVAHRVPQQPRPPPPQPPARGPTVSGGQPTTKTAKGKATPGLRRKSSKVRSQSTDSAKKLESPQPAPQTERSQKTSKETSPQEASSQEGPVKRKPGRPPKRKSKDGESTCPVTAKVKREASSEDPDRPRSDSAVKVTALAGASAVSAAHTELLVLVRRRGCDVQSVAMRLHRHATPAGLQAVIKAIIKLCMGQEIDLLSTLYTLCSKSSAANVVGWKPFLADHEVKLTQLLCCLDATPQFEGIVRELLEAARDVVLRPDAASVLVRASLCRVCAALCRQRGEAGHVRVLLYDIIVTQVTGFPTLTVAMASVWPQLLQRTVRQGPQSLIGALEHVVMKRVAGDKLRLTKLAACLRALCQWEVPAAERYDSTVLVRETLHLLKAEAGQPKPSKDTLCELEQSLVLVACTEDWTWTNNVLVVDCLWPQLREWAGAQTGRVSSDISHTLCESLIRVMGHVVSRCPAAHTNAACDVIAMMKPLVLGVPGATIPTAVQLAALESLLRLAPFNQQTVAEVANTWVGQNLLLSSGWARTVTGPEHHYLDGLLSQFVRAYTEVLTEEKFTNLASFK